MPDHPPMVHLADARDLPFEDRTFDFIFTSPPWDRLDVLTEARGELTRVLTRKGLMVMILPHLDSPRLASMVVTSRDWSERQSFVCEKPSQRVGPRYFSMADDFVRRVLLKYRPTRVLDPFCGVGTVPRIARSLGMHGEGCDIDADALAVA